MSRSSVFIAVIICATPVCAETAYFALIEDLPIAPGLEETADRFEFTNADVRELGSSAGGRAQAEQVRTYYGEALPALGWALSVGSGGENETVYLRGREELSLNFHQRGEDLNLEVLVFSRPPPHD
jgi:hypothetical protein